jgi:hypothetical protein
MNKFYACVAAGVLLFVVLSCGLADKLTGGDKLTKTEDLWSDVPQMDGMTHSELELPFAVKLLMRTALNNLWRFNKEGEDKTPASGDWGAYQTGGTPSDVQDFYTNSRMSSFGNWETTKNSTCIDGKDKGVDGVICVFKKTVDTNDVGLAIIAMPDEKKKTNIFFIRVESPQDKKR